MDALVYFPSFAFLALVPFVVTFIGLIYIRVTSFSKVVSNVLQLLSRA